MHVDFEQRCRSTVESLGLSNPNDIISVTRLTGGVASDIAIVRCVHKTICVKFALEKLRVQEDWYAPVHRSQAEFAWLGFAKRVVPDAAPNLYGWSEPNNGFAMEYIDGPDVHLWKSQLLDGPWGVYMQRLRKPHLTPQPLILMQYLIH